VRDPLGQDKAMAAEAKGGGDVGADLAGAVVVGG
jgi:hypothetical protein